MHQSFVRMWRFFRSFMWLLGRLPLFCCWRTNHLAKCSERLQNDSNTMQSLTVQRIYQYSREQFLYLITLVLFANWCYEAIDWYIYSLNRYGTGSILNDEITQIYLLYAFTPAVYACSQTAYAQDRRVLRFVLRTYLGLVLTLSVFLGMFFSYVLSIPNL